MRALQGSEDRFDNGEFEADALGDLNSGAVRIEVEQLEHQLRDQVLAQARPFEGRRRAEIDSRTSSPYWRALSLVSGHRSRLPASMQVRLDVFAQTTAPPKDVDHHEHAENGHHSNIHHHNLQRKTDTS